MIQESSSVSVDGLRFTVTFERSYDPLDADWKHHRCRYCERFPDHRKMCRIMVVQVLDARSRTIGAKSPMYQRTIQEVSRRFGHNRIVCADCRPWHEQQTLT